MDIIHSIAALLNVKSEQVAAAVALLDGGATVPFISRYRKEATGGLDDTQLRLLEEKLNYLRELNLRREAILKSIKEQDKLTEELEKAILETDNKATLEDLYLPYKPKRRTKAQIAKEAGLLPLAMDLLTTPTLVPETYAEKFVDAEKGVANVKDALDGARQILMEYFAEDAEILAELRDYIWQHAIVKSEVAKGKESEAIKFTDYFDYQEAIKKIPSHRALAIFRGQREECLNLHLVLDDEQSESLKQKIAARFNVQDKHRASDAWLMETVAWTFKIKLFLKFELELFTKLREQSEEEAIKVFGNNLKHLLMAAPAGSRVTLGLDPGLRTGVKVVVIDGTSKLLAHTVIYPHAPKNEWQESLAILSKLCAHFRVELISIGNGTASRETDKLAHELKNMHPDLKLTPIVVSEAGASVYSASELAAKEFPELDVSYRGAVSIARRLQDPLAELVKIEPKAIGVGQYQHDVNQVKLSRALVAVMEDCVNAVGVDVNTASVPLLTCIAGLNQAIANQIVLYRDQHGLFKDRLTLKKVSRLGEKAFEQAAGFLRIVNGDSPLDASSVHPEAYSVVETILQKENKKIEDLIGNVSALRKLKPADYINDQFGLPTVTDILKELEKPGRDPRPEFKTATFKEGIEKIQDVKPGMLLEGVITNVANFGAFVDIGVHQDGLVHISMLSDTFVKNPNDVVKVGDIVKVKVIEVDVARKRISLSMKLQEAHVKAAAKPVALVAKKTKVVEATSSTMGSLFQDALKKSK